MASIASNIISSDAVSSDVVHQIEKEKIVIVFVLDVSHSMFSWISSGEMKKAATEFLVSCKLKYEDATVIFTQFGTNVKISDPTQIKLAEVPHLEPDGMTAFYEATCKSINIANTISDKGILFIISDGKDNSSLNEYTSEVFSKTISELEKKNWEICFIGANEEIVKYGISSGIPETSCAAYDECQPGSMLSLSRAVSIMVSSKDKSTPLDIRALSTPPSRPELSKPHPLMRSRAVGPRIPMITPRKLNL